MLLITPPTTPQRCNRGSRSSLPLGGRINFQPFKLEQSAKAALSSLHSDGYRQVHPTSPSNFNTHPTSNPDSCWCRNPPVLVSLSPTCTASAVSVRDFVTDRLAGHAGRITSLLSWLGFAGVPCPPSSSAIDRGSSFIRCGSFIRSPRTRWRLGVGAAASSRWAFWVPHTRRRVLVTSAGRSPFIRCASFTGNAHSRATSRIASIWRYFSAPNPKTALYPKLLRRPHPPTKTPSHGFYRVFGWFGFGWLEKFNFGTLYHFLASGFYPVFSKNGICGKRKLQNI